jgi:hypothetical protein
MYLYPARNEHGYSTYNGLKVCSSADKLNAIVPKVITGKREYDSGE